MLYHNITHDDMLNGTGLRVVLWVSGCEHKCPHCQNPQTWDASIGCPFTDWEEAEFWEWLSKPWTEGATFSGGDPLHPANRDFIGNLAERIKNRYPNKNIWVYTGYDLIMEENNFVFTSKDGRTFSIPWLDKIDVLVDGRFDYEIRKKDVAENKKVYWRGSSNQRIIDIPSTIALGDIVVRKDLL